MLSVVIPTYNREMFLDRSLSFHLPIFKKNNINLYVFDNGSEDNTANIVEKWSAIYDNLYYHKNIINLGVDANIEIALKYPQSEYIWLLGDSYRLSEFGVDNVVALLKNKIQYDAIVINVDNAITSIPVKDFVNANDLLYSLGAFMTCLSATIYSKKIIRDGNFEKFRNTNFIQTGIILDYISNNIFKIHWAQNISLSNFSDIAKKKKSWSMTSAVFEIAGVNWINFVFSLPPSYTLENKLFCIRDFFRYSGVFSLRHFMILRSLDILNFETYRKYSLLFPILVSYNSKLIFIISILPISVAVFIRSLSKFLKK